MTKLSLFSENIHDREILQWITDGNKMENKALEYLYRKHYRTIEKNLLARGAKKEDVKDVFHEAIIAFYENVKTKKFQLQQNIIAYLVTLSKRIWINKQKKEGRISLSQNWTQLEDSLVSETTLAENIDWEMQDRVLSIMNQLTEDCRKILELSIYQKLEMREIARLMGYKNAQIARNKKSRCLSKLKTLIQASGYFKS